MYLLIELKIKINYRLAKIKMIINVRHNLGLFIQIKIIKN
jgi:hypothetical protein